MTEREKLVLYQFEMLQVFSQVVFENKTKIKLLSSFDNNYIYWRMMLQHVPLHIFMMVYIVYSGTD